MYGLPPQISEIGIYQITRVWGNREKLLYIGIVWSDSRKFINRVKEHREYWLGEFKGVTYRFAHVVPARGLVRDRALVEEIEGALINELRPPHNDRKHVSYSLRSDLNIISLGARGAVPRRIDTGTHEWVNKPGGRAREIRH